MLFNGHLADESLVADAVLVELGGVNPDLRLSRVQHVGHAQVKQVVDLHDGSPQLINKLIVNLLFLFLTGCNVKKYNQTRHFYK